MSWTGQDWGPEQLRFVTGLTGDGRAGIVGFGTDGVWTAVNIGGSAFGRAHKVLTSFNSQGWHTGQHLRFVVDLTSDGKADIIGFGDNDVGTALSNWWRSKNGTEPWKVWKTNTARFPNRNPDFETPGHGFVGRFGPAGAFATLMIDENRIGHFQSVGQGGSSVEWQSLFPY
jgi:hypothetical protein